LYLAAILNVQIEGLSTAMKKQDLPDRTTNPYATTMTEHHIDLNILQIALAQILSWTIQKYLSLFPTRPPHQFF